MSGLIVNVGGGICHTVPYYEGVCIFHAIQRLDTSGSDINNFLSRACSQRGDKVSDDEAEIIKKIFCVSPSPANIPSDNNLILGHGFRKNGAQVPLGREMFDSIEILFQPDQSEKESLGLAQMIQRTISQCDIDCRKALWSNIVVCGGSSMFKGFIERLQAEVSKLTPGDTVAFVNAAPDRMSNTHSGANNLAFYNEFYSLCITPDEFTDEGENIFDIKCNN